MKSNIHRVNYDGTTNINGDWWVWKETCDRCGKLIFDETAQHSYPGDESELDFCTECLRYLMDNNISYEQAIVLYGRINKKKGVIHIRHISLNVLEEIKHILPDILEKDLQDNEEICPICHGLGVKKWDNPYGIKGDTSEVVKKSMFPYKHQSLLPCPNCYNGIVNICKYCGKQLPKGRLKCDCEQQKAIDKEEKRIKYRETIAKAKEVDIKFVFTYLYDEQTDQYFAEIEDFVEEYKYNTYFDSDEEMLNNLPEVLWVCSEANISMDAGSIIENACNDLHEDALDAIPYEDKRELQEFLDKWCEKQSGTRTYYPCYKEYVRVQKEWFD